MEYTYLSLLRGRHKFAVVDTVVAYIDVGIKLESDESTERLTAPGSRTSMVTHRVRITDAAQLDSGLLA